MEGRIKALEDALSQTNKRQLSLKDSVDAILTAVSEMQGDPDTIEKMGTVPGVNVRFMDAMERVESGLKAMAEGVKSTAELVSENSKQIAGIEARLHAIESELEEISKRT